MAFIFAICSFTPIFDQISFESTVLILFFDCCGIILILFTYKSVFVELTKIKIKSIKTTDKTLKVPDKINTVYKKLNWLRNWFLKMKETK